MHKIAQLHPAPKAFRSQMMALGGFVFTLTLILAMLIREPAANQALEANQTLAYLWAALSIGLIIYGFMLVLIGATGECPWHTNRLTAWPARWDGPPKWVRRR